MKTCDIQKKIDISATACPKTTAAIPRLKDLKITESSCAVAGVGKTEKRKKASIGKIIIRIINLFP